MTEQTRRAIFLATVVFAMMLTVGCEEQMSTKKGRLIADENIQLRKQLEGCKVALEAGKKKLIQCVEEKKVLKENAKKDTETLVSGILENVDELSSELRRENESLKAQVLQLETQVKKSGSPE